MPSKEEVQTPSPAKENADKKQDGPTKKAPPKKEKKEELVRS